MTPNARTFLLIVDGLALLGVVVFSVLAAVEPDTSAYVIGQIVCALLILGSVLLLRRTRDNSAGGGA